MTYVYFVRFIEFRKKGQNIILKGCAFPNKRLAIEFSTSLMDLQAPSITKHKINNTIEEALTSINNDELNLIGSI